MTVYCKASSSSGGGGTGTGCGTLCKAQLSSGNACGVTCKASLSVTILCGDTCLNSAQYADPISPEQPSIEKATQWAAQNNLVEYIALETVKKYSLQILLGRSSDNKINVNIHFSTTPYPTTG